VVNIEANEAKSARVLVEREQRACEATETEAQALEEQVRSRASRRPPACAECVFLLRSARRSSRGRCQVGALAPRACGLDRARAELQAAIESVTSISQRDLVSVLER
jgi:hypothetical protein